MSDELKKETTGCLKWFFALIVLWSMIYILYSCATMETYEEEEEWNPYTEDFDGDGLNGDKDDHDIYHELYK